MFHIKAAITGILIAALLPSMAAIAHAAGWAAALKIATILLMAVGGLALAALAIYALGLRGMGLVALIFSLPLILFGEIKDGVTALLRRG